jgi:hypothetical protein
MSSAINKRVRQRDLAITGVTRGNDIGFKFTLATPTALIVARFVVKANFGDADPGVVSKTITTTPSSDGQILDTGQTTGVAIMLFNLTKTETDDFTAGQIYVWDIEVFDGSNNSATPRGGTIEFTQRVRTAIG